MVPAAHRNRYIFGILKPHLAQICQCFGVVFCAGEDKVAGRTGQRNVIFEQFRIIVFNVAQMQQQVSNKASPVGIAKEGCQCMQAFITFRQGLGLLIIDHLQPMFDGAQERIGAEHFIADIF